MKRIVLVATLMMAVSGMKAQDCDAIMLPFFRGTVAAMNNYKYQAPDKFEYRCTYARSAFIESDTIPSNVSVYDISQVQNRHTAEYLPQDFVIDLNTLSYYAYNFQSFQMKYRRGNVTLCFSTPSSTHPYLVLRSIEDSFQLASEMEAAYYQDRD